MLQLIRRLRWYAKGQGWWWVGIGFVIGSILVLLMTGCVGYLWTHPQATQERFDRDKAECSWRGASTGAGSGLASGLMIGSAAMANCMEIRGWTKCKKPCAE